MTMWMVLLVLCFGSSIFAWCAEATSSYRAATTMHYPIFPSTNATPRNVHVANLLKYTTLVQTAFAGAADIIVFPESGTGYLMVPDAEIQSFCEPMPPVGWASDDCPFNKADAFDESRLRQYLEAPSDFVHARWGSCAAQVYRMDIVFNFGFYDIISGHYYNANAVFRASSGILLAIYRKSHINAVPFLTQPATPDHVMFVSSFGVSFGMGVCYDLWFHEPWEAEMRRANVTDFVYPNGMASLAPLETIDQLHAGFSLVHDVNFISSALFSTGGAGAFHRGQPLQINPIMPFLATPSNVIVTEVPIIDSHRHPSTMPSRLVGSRRRDDDEHAVTISGQRCFNGSASCAVFDTSRAPVTVTLEASYEGPFGNVSCTAVVVTNSTSNQTWMLAAAQLDMVPSSPRTPDANEAAFCIVMQCADVEVGCPFGAPIPSLWTSDLRVSSVSVSATFGGGFSNASDVLFFPIYGLVDAMTSSSAGNSTTPNATTLFPLTFPPVDSSVYASRPAGSGSPFVMIMDGPGVSDNFLFSAGIYVAKKGSTYHPEQRDV
eukprot:CAMPEP_0176428526 /NCGR_PEP_ID=MMETSP0127-20121128/13200_1 /TAXON_ID=938130 /ORGANISM="Platyophrya macrostoma, Strain WH" /LENGTH=546 /DNA_ID=CAMNT_0017810221 /DNA_START=59 /DNA_END=1699 /DNA_ORIENTATION=+